MQDKKKIVIGALCALIMIMAVGYALLSQQLSINGSASITSNWQVEITNIRELEKSTGAATNNTNYTATTASFNTNLTSPGDYALYEVTVTNKGTLDAVLSAKPTVTTGNNEAIEYELEGIKKGDKILKNNQTDTFTIKVTYNSSTTKQPSTLTSNIEITLNYEQDLGQVEPDYDYVVGDEIQFNESKWYVIKNSTEEEDYITLMKERVLTAQELGEYRLYYSKYDAGPVMAYYWSDTCHDGTSKNLKCYKTGTCYSSSVSSGCAGHNDYDGSKIKEFLEEIYINTLDSEKLKEVNGYKIRLIQLEELENNLGITYGDKCTPGCLKAYGFTENTPNWVYQNFGEDQNNVYEYWTMTPYPDSSLDILFVYENGLLNANGSGNITNGKSVRPVINLYKSAIE